MIQSIVQLEANRCARADVHCLGRGCLRAVTTHGLRSDILDRGIVERLTDGRVCSCSTSNDCCPDVYNGLW